MKKSNLTEFIDGNYIQSPSEYFATSKRNIRKLIDAQTVHEQRALRCIIEIGKTLSDLYDYKKRSQSPRIDKMWNDLVAEFQYSPATVTSTSGRTDIVALSTPPKIKKKSKIQIPIMSLLIDKNDWISSYKSFEDDLIEFLNSKEISYALSSQVKSLDKSEVARSKKIDNYIYKQSKAHFNKVVKNHIDNTCRSKNLCSPKTPFKKKMKLLKFGIDEVTTEGCISTAEIEERFISLGIQEESIWNEHLMKWTADAFEKFPSRISELVRSDKTEEFENFVQQYKSKNFTPVKKIRDLSRFKV